MGLSIKYTQIGQKIKSERKQLGLSQKSLADYINYESATAISLIEAGERKITVEDLEKIANLFHKDIGFFLGQKGKTSSLKIALRSDTNLTTKDKEQILKFVEFVKKSK